ncbi:hypothetical protein N7495_004422 [Penicillium taxi]|uniref:uncharacterized protein n=1 Tax=Penicillium taxi TaxID=168475 RepID=UPI0025456020|nr:uncharacterized protein N7495_004422 [Penicillium taxi]KAJ5899678.1 hypothetical protein N7495_004422 [Penicillium taxi]
MIRSIFTGLPAHVARPTSAPIAIFKNQFTQPIWQYANATPASLRATRPFSSTSPVSFTGSSIKSSSPFRFSSDKHDEIEYPEDDPYSAYPPKRHWPPDMKKLSPKHQFRLERKYRRRAALKYARPKFMKFLTIAQWGVIGFVVVYAVLLMEWDTKDTPFDGLREKFFAGLRSIFSTPPPPGPLKSANKDGPVSQEK